LIAQIGELQFQKRMLREEQKSLLARRTRENDDNTEGADNGDESDDDDRERQITYTTKDGVKLQMPNSSSLRPSPKKGNQNWNGITSYQKSIIPSPTQLKQILPQATKDTTTKTATTFKEPRY
jgi:hypothetical protein